MTTPIAIVGVACEFPGANSPEALWETALHQWRWFRNIPTCRLDPAYIFDKDLPGWPKDKTTLRRAALLEGYELPLSSFSLGDNDVRTADFVHWLSLDCASRAIKDSGLAGLLPKDSTRVIVANTLNGESSRAELLRLRWPYVRKTLEESGCTGTDQDWNHREHHFKKRLAEIKGRTLAGALPNVIAGRIANHFDFKGGCFNVDAACASSLVAIAQACSQLASGEIDCALVGGVDVSLDPLELVGFSVAGALCMGEMKVFDENRSGFIPGEGCGFAVLLRADDPLVAKAHHQATIRGWAVSSDGRHDLTAPSSEGQGLVLQRAYKLAGYGIDTVPLFEAHGTGTEVGDRVELATLAAAIGRTAQPASVGSIKANIGHTKAAAGMAGLIKVVKALESRVIPPITGCVEPMRELREGSSVRVVRQAEAWPEKGLLRASVSGFGFGGVNAHLTLEHPGVVRAPTIPPSACSPAPDAELFVFAGDTKENLIASIRQVQSLAAQIADAEVASVARCTAAAVTGKRHRAAVTASTPGELHQQLHRLAALLETTDHAVSNGSVYIGGPASGTTVPVRYQTPTATTSASLAAAFIAGEVIDFAALYAGRCLPDFDLAHRPLFFTSPCERAPLEPGNDSTRSPEGNVDSLTPLAALHEVLRKAKGHGYEPTPEEDQVSTLSSLEIDSLGLFEVIAGVERLGFKLRGKSAPNNRMTVMEFASLFDMDSVFQSDKTLSDQLEPWIREFQMVWKAAPLPVCIVPAPSAAPASWKTLSTSPLPTGFAPRCAVGSPGMLVCCDKEPSPVFLGQLLAALSDHPAGSTLVVMDATGLLPGLIKTFGLEHPEVRVVFIHYVAKAMPSSTMVEAELADDFTFREVLYDVNGARSLPCYEVTGMDDVAKAACPLLGSSDVVFVTGGARGITAECMIALAAGTGAKIAIVARSSAEDQDVLQTRHQLTKMGVAHHYWSVDVSDAAAVARVVEDVPKYLGPITAILHGAGVHAPCAFKELTWEKLDQHCRAKVTGMRNVLAAVGTGSLRYVIAFGSVIARSGYPRSAAYAYANDQLACLISRFQQQHPHVRCRTLDWSVWSSVGMGVDLQAIEPLKAAGVDPIATVEGTTAFLAHLRRTSPSSRPILAGRLPSFQTVSFSMALPAFDWPDSNIVSFTPGVELVVDIALSLENDPWLSGHTMRDGKVILPGVLALQIMERTASALAPTSALGTARDIEFSYPVTLPPAEEQLRVRVQAVLEFNGRVVCRLAERGKSLSSPAVIAEFGSLEQDVVRPEQQPSASIQEADGRDIALDVYAHLLFHRGEFQRIERYSAASAQEAVFHLRSAAGLGYRTQEAIIARDAFIHGIQVCVPNELLLPSKVGRMTRFRPADTASIILAREVSASSGVFTYHLTALDSSGQLVERWENLELRRYENFDTIDQLHSQLQLIHQERSQAAVTNRYFEYRHTIGFKETNVVGNVYYTNHLEWQGRCREMFLKAHAPELLGEVESGRLALVTVSCSCEYEVELHAFDELSVRMTLAARGTDWATMRFEYWRTSPGQPQRIATGQQTIAARERNGTGLHATALPPVLVTALQPYTSHA